MNSSDRRMTLVLKAPQSPLSAVMITIWRRPPSRRASSGWRSGAVRRARLPRRADILWAWGRASRIRSWARRSLAAATSFMARVIFWVDWTARILRRMSRRVATVLGGLDALGLDELGLGLGDRPVQGLPEGVRELALVPDLVVDRLFSPPPQRGGAALERRGR